MANTYHQVYVQTIFAPKYRNAVLAKEWQQELFGLIGNLINKTGCKTIIVNGVEDHVHCFLGLKPTICISDLMKIAKAKSSKHINDHHLTACNFEWQEGYGAFSYSHTQLNDVYNYILHQEEHHKTQTFKEEYLGFLNEFDISYDLQYILHDPI